MKQLIVIILLLNATSATAELVQRYWEFGTIDNTDVTFDTESGLEWLDVSKTEAVSVVSMEQRLASSHVYEGFRHATQSEVIALFEHAGLTEHGLCYFCDDTDNVIKFIDYFGITYDWTSSLFSKGINGFVNESNSVGGRYYASVGYDPGDNGDPWTAVSSHAGVLTPTNSIQGVGHFLVRAAVIPTPVDSDGDGVPDDLDQCPNSFTADTVLLELCNSSISNIVDEAGCTISDRIYDCYESADHHGQYISCTSELATKLVDEYKIYIWEKSALTKCAAKSKIE